MVVQIGDRSQAGVAYDLAGTDPAFNVALGVAVVSGDGFAIRGFISNSILTVSGYVSGGQTGIALAAIEAGDYTSGHRLTIGASGQVVGGVGLDDHGVYIQAHQSIVTNAGTIFGFTGVSMTGLLNPANANAQSQLINTGIIQGMRWGVDRLPMATEKLTIINKGTIASQHWAIDGGGDSVEIVVNQGWLRGIVELRAGNDLFDNRLGKLLPLIGTQPGEVLMGDGDDIVRPGAGAERFFGGNGDDTVDFRFSGAVKFSLAGAITATGVARGDQYSEFENVEGSLKGHDLLMGTDGLSGSANVLKGHGGNDTLQGLGGNDTLTGGTGRDRLSGGEGSDIFIYNSAAEGRDVITDFTNTATSDDTFYLRLSGFKAGLALGALNAERLHIGRSNRAAERDDRFIFDKKTTTLWFDADGSGRKGPVLIADLQAGAVLTAADIFLFA